MKGNPYCTQNCRMVTIQHSSIQLGDNSLREYIVCENRLLNKKSKIFFYLEINVYLCNVK